MVDFSQILIYFHAALGGVALICGMIALLSKKGSRNHKKSGIVFFYSMLGSAFLALIISFLPDHESLFLFLIGIFSSYFLIGGYRALKFKKEKLKLTLDIFIAWVMLLTAIGMMLGPVILYQKINIVLVVFGVVGLIFSIRDLSLYKNIDRLKKGWLKIHIGKMMGGYISAFTAFMVVNQFIPGIYGWFLPGVIGGAYITYWMRKLDSKNV